MSRCYCHMIDIVGFVLLIITGGNYALILTKLDEIIKELFKIVKNNRLPQHAEGLIDPSQMKYQYQEGKWTQSPFLPQKLSLTKTACKGKKWFSLMDSHWIYKLINYS